MAANLSTLIEHAESSLDAEGRERLATLVANFVSAHGTSANFSLEEIEYLKRIEQEPSAPADPTEVAEFFAGRG